ncbi:hypothetical protein HR060_05605 [Catenovulum sp. SM1970]|uniref:hypothetical protein n=1 Tax=Marinifaba aquimaris TaxID=2741323 RepID=UPI0015730238|nr:hypothetical protein [Marinifaba aquimaris]NTS76339.1 hypothetical protein [Marinifaba aquimaris]
MSNRASYNITTRNDIVIIKIMGSFDRLLSQRCFKELKKTLEGLPANRPFVLLVNALRYTGATPEAFEQATLFNQWLKGTSCIAKAYVVVQKIQLQIVKNHAPEMPDILHNDFDNQEQALTWLEELLLHYK